MEKFLFIIAYNIYYTNTIIQNSRLPEYLQIFTRTKTGHLPRFIVRQTWLALLNGLSIVSLTTNYESDSLYTGALQSRTCRLASQVRNKFLFVSSRSLSFLLTKTFVS